jgi:hypothetical protein
MAQHAPLVAVDRAPLGTTQRQSCACMECAADAGKQRIFTRLPLGLA